MKDSETAYHACVMMHDFFVLPMPEFRERYHVGTMGAGLEQVKRLAGKVASGVSRDQEVPALSGQEGDGLG